MDTTDAVLSRAENAIRRARGLTSAFSDLLEGPQHRADSNLANSCLEEPPSHGDCLDASSACPVIGTGTPAALSEVPSGDRGPIRSAERCGGAASAAGGAPAGAPPPPARKEGAGTACGEPGAPEAEQALPAARPQPALWAGRGEPFAAPPRRPRAGAALRGGLPPEGLRTCAAGRPAARGPAAPAVGHDAAAPQAPARAAQAAAAAAVGAAVPPATEAACIEGSPLHLSAVQQAVDLLAESLDDVHSVASALQWDGEVSQVAAVAQNVSEADARAEEVSMMARQLLAALRRHPLRTPDGSSQAEPATRGASAEEIARHPTEAAARRALGAARPARSASRSSKRATSCGASSALLRAADISSTAGASTSGSGSAAAAHCASLRSSAEPLATEGDIGWRGC
eukprot:CAMPEP_0177592340 /NCGR_PEP_ID=MMETSP0419_2-20121207/8502_1 /TAXON_ID=582737 /ORGANISM="Tetraselmis sp., Strain GSL018" /LENGTH=399 /DNA_ID=CAMNT_0019083189 /DNA_START=141 /DNA_END=1342 /DNA_ORIENTATION=+